MKQYKFGTGTSWEGSRRSGVTLSDTEVYPPTGSTAKDREMSTHAYAPLGRGTVYVLQFTRQL